MVALGHHTDFTLTYSGTINDNQEKFWDNFMIQIGALVLILLKLEALTCGTIPILPSHISDS